MHVLNYHHSTLSFDARGEDDKFKYQRVNTLVPKRDDLIEYLNSKDIHPGVHYTPNTEYTMYRYAKGTCPNADYVGDHVLSLPLHMRISEEDVKYINNCLCEFILNINRSDKLKVPDGWFD